YTISDGAGGTDTGTVTVTIFGVNDDPVAADDAFTIDGTTILNGDLFADNGSGTDSDVDDFDQIEVIEVDGITGAVGEPITLISGATVTVGFDGTFSYDAIGIFDGLGAGESTTDSFNYTISDFNGGTDVGTVNITIEGVNEAPVADDETAFTSEDTQLLAIDVLTGDTDADGDTLFVSAASALNGIVVINPDYTLNYTPNLNHNGDDTITYTVDDGNGGTDTGTVFVTVGAVNDNPVADDETASTNEDTSISSIDVLTGDTDVDGDTLSVLEATALHGSVFVNEDGTLNYTPDADFNGTDTITYSIHDGNDGTDTGEVTVTVSPIVDIADDTASTVQDTSVTVDVLNNDTFEDEGAFVSGFTQGTSGSVVIDTGNVLTYTPNEGFTGTDTFEYTVNSGGVTETATVTINVGTGNSPPTAVDDTASTNEDTALSNIDVLVNDFDPDEDSLTITQASALNGSVVIEDNGTLTYTPDLNYNGADTISYQINDGNDGTDPDAVSVTVAAINDNPVADDETASTSEDTAISAIDVLTGDT
ncbi:MAG: Ig-like domain-containing protein, partial [Planctomycetota bacterium]